MARSVLDRVKPIKSDLIPPAGSTTYGTTPDGRIIYQRTMQRGRAVPKLDAEGNRVWRKHPLTGEPLLPVNQGEVYEATDLFTLLDQLNGNVEMVPYHVPTAEELAAETRVKKVVAMKDQLAEALVDAGVDPANLLADLKALAVPAATPIVPAAAMTEPPVPSLYPMAKGGGWYLLSNGTKMQGSEEAAQEAEAAIAEAKKEAAKVPEE
jgi:hypothetical protein